MASSSSNPPPPPPPHKPSQNHWPTIKVYRPPQGQHSRAPDERCISYFSQTIAGRIQKIPPYTKTICIRRVFKHEVANVLGYPSHDDIVDGAARYPLPPEGQPAPLPEEDGTPVAWTPPPQSQTHYYQEGWYLWYSSSKYAMQEKLDLMKDLAHQTQWEQSKAAKLSKWNAQENKYVQSLSKDAFGNAPQHRPPPPALDPTRRAVLIHIRPPSIFATLENLMVPANKMRAVVNTALEERFFTQFAHKAVESVKTGAPLKLIQVAWERWRKNEGDGDGDA